MPCFKASKKDDLNSQFTALTLPLDVTICFVSEMVTVMFFKTVAKNYAAVSKRHVFFYIYI